MLCPLCSNGTSVKLHIVATYETRGGKKKSVLCCDQAPHYFSVPSKVDMSNIWQVVAFIKEDSQTLIFRMLYGWLPQTDVLTDYKNEVSRLPLVA